MNVLFIGKWLPVEIVRAVCWTLLHSIWQSLVLAIIAGTVVILTRKSKPVLRYNILSCLFLSYLVVVALTFVYDWRLQRSPGGTVYTSAPTSPDVAFGQPGNTVPVTEVAAPGFLEKFVGYFNEHASLVVTIWFIIFCALFVKMLANIAWVERIKHYRSHQASAEWKDKVRQIAARLQVRRFVTLLESELAKVPMVVGFLKPVIIVPIGLLTNLPPDEVESILSHELAHIKRRDYFINLVQVFAETTLFFNPAMLWVSSLIRQEREVCCDEMAVQQGSGGKVTYINALVSFQEYYLGRYAPQTVLAFPGQKNHVLNRVKRLVMKDNKNLNYVEKITMACTIVLITGAIALSTNRLFAQERSPAATVQSQQDENTNTISDTTPPSGQNTEIKFPDPSRSGDDENYLNTVTTTDKDGNRYKYVSIGDKMPRFYVNDELISKKKMNKYSDLISKLEAELWKRQEEEGKKREEELSEGSSQKLSEIANDLIREKLVANKEQVASFRLTSNEFVVNGEKQPYETFARYKNKYIKSAYDVYKFNSLTSGK
jgi:beta-lactamase regulating signal transducer with metallopeptidase domain